MASPGLVVFARFRANVGWEDHVRTALLEAMPPTLLEEANVGYAVHQAASDPRLFLLYEQWTGKPGFENHLQQPHFRELAKRLEEALAQPLEILETEMIGGEVAPAASGD
jgi:quinol monooxygenase YgiN